MWKYYFILILLPFIQNGCVEKRNVILVETTGLYLEKNTNFNSLLFTNSNSGFIAGSIDSIFHNPDMQSDTFAFIKRKAVLFNTKDGGKNWKKFNFDEGTFMQVLENNGSLYAIKVSDQDNVSVIYSSSDNGDHWSEFLRAQNVIADILFSDSYGFFVVAKNSLGIFKFYRVNEHKKLIEEFNSIEPIFDLKLIGDNLLYLSSDDSDNYKKNIVVIYNIKSREKRIVKLPDHFSGETITNFGNDIRINGTINSDIVILSFNDWKIKIKETFSLDKSMYPIGFYNNHDCTFVVAGKIFGGLVLHYLLEKRQKNQNWKVVHFEIPDYISPFSFVAEGKRIIGKFYAGVGKFQIFYWQ